jgi:hypothetical protein
VQKVPLAEFEARYTTTGTKVYASFSDDSDDEDYIYGDVSECKQ